ncbi:hypothetical protein VTN77DRAFT_3305 [Rasamsonia byssochlamydoides]|uniref:uncharacterized protein n=1 Tax=Rasamsonia byssochlamydoides TaxID=89139 RepID=UPI003743B218
MKLFLFVFLCSLIQVALAVQPQKSVIVTYPQDTPDSILGQAKQVIQDAGGIITHEYHLIKGFAAKASANAIKSVSTLSAAFNPIIEEDKIVSVDGDFVGEENEF